MKRWQKRPEGSNWGDFGPDDRLGRMNLVTPARRRAGAAEIREGLAFCLSLPLNYPGYTGEKRGPRKPPRLMALTDDNKSWYHTMLGPQGCCPQESICDDGVLLSLQYSTQWDSFAHYGRLFDANDDGEAEKVYYNGYTAQDDFLRADQEGGPYALSLGIENMAATSVQGRGVMLDLCAAYGKDRRWIGYDDFMRAMEAQNVTVEPGDFLLIHTGYGAAIIGMGNAADQAELDRTGAVLDASDERLLRWVSESGVAALCSDNVAVEGVDFSGPRHENGLLLPLHELCLFKLGIHLGELWYLSELASWLRAHQRNAFLLTAPPLRLPGAVGSPATPVATV